MSLPVCILQQFIALCGVQRQDALGVGKSISENPAPEDPVSHSRNTWLLCSLMFPFLLTFFLPFFLHCFPPSFCNHGDRVYIQGLARQAPLNQIPGSLLYLLFQQCLL